MSSEFGTAIKKRRQEKGWNQAEFAVLAGISEGYLSLIERGLRVPPVDDKVRQIADLLAIHRDDLMYLAKRLPEDVRAVAESSPEMVTKLVRNKVKGDQ
jgi:transcriptional regulator with XRE-family HTH domain